MSEIRQHFESRTEILASQKLSRQYLVKPKWGVQGRSVPWKTCVLQLKTGEFLHVSTKEIVES